jgi:hypothetical protein
MKKIALSLLLLALAPLQAKAFNTQTVYSQNDVLSYVAMPLAVSSVCDVRGVQTDRVGELVTYMDQANVAPSDFVDVFRYVPVALVMRTDRRPDFVAWVHGEVDRGVVGVDLVTGMERQLGTYSNYVTVSSRYRSTRYRSRYYDYAYRDAFAGDYVPVVVQRYCDRELIEPFALVDMPVAVANVCDLGIPYPRVSSLAVELNLGGIPPLQFVELFRYAPAALVVTSGYGPDFVEYVHTQEVAGVYGLPLVAAIGAQFPAYGISAQIDLSSPGYYYSAQNYYNPTYSPIAPQFAAQYYVPPADPVYVPPVVQTRVASGYVVGGTNWRGSQAAPAIAAAPQVQRLLNSPNGAAVVTNPGEARRELARGGGRMGRESPMIAQPAGGVPSFAPSFAHGGGRERHMIPTGPAAVAPEPVMAGRVHGNGQGNGHGRGQVASPGPVFAQPQPQPQFHGEGHGHRAVTQAQAPAAVPPPMVAAPQFVEHGHGHGGPPVAVAPAPAPVAVAPQANGGGKEPPGQEKKKGKDH